MTCGVTTRGIQTVGAWCVLGYVGCLVVGWWLISGFGPPWFPLASYDAAKVAALYQHNHTMIALGMVINLFGAVMFIPWTAVVATFISRIEGGVGVLTIWHIIGGMGNTILTFYPPLWWLVACFRPDRAPDTIRFLNDTGFLQFLGGVAPFVPLQITIALAAFADNSEHPVFPRWAGFFNLLVVLLVLPDQLIFFFYNGPFTWTGLFGFWIPVLVFFVWLVVMFWLLRKAIAREPAAG